MWVEYQIDVLAFWITGGSLVRIQYTDKPRIPLIHSVKLHSDTEMYIAASWNLMPGL